MFLQTARYLIKAWNQALNGEKLPPTVAYLEVYAKKRNVKEEFENSPRGIFRAFQFAAAKKIADANKHLEERKKFLTPEEATNQTGLELIKASELHCQGFLLQVINLIFYDNFNLNF
jgi:acyl-CoA oxidase